VDQFESALAEESKWLAHVEDQPMPTDSRAGHRTYIGPTAVDLSMLPDSMRESLIRQREQKLLSAWHHHDHRGYRANSSVRSF
jgi:hypothetical protein